MKLSHRHQQLLVGLVETYIETAQPVGSRLLLTRLTDCTLCSASVRCCLVELSERGLLQQVHKSGGRIPTELGFRAYVNTLQHSRLKPWDRHHLDATKKAEPHHFPLHLGQTLSNLAKQVAVITMPKLKDDNLREIGLVWCSPTRILLYVLSTRGELCEQLLTLPHPSSATEVQRMANFLNTRLSQKSWQEAAACVQADIADTRAQRTILEQQALHLGAHVLRQVPVEVVVEGTEHLFEQPEFADLATLRRLLTALQHHEIILELLTPMLNRQGVTVRLGSEHSVTAVDGLTCVAASWGSQQNSLWSISLLGPSRMDYGRLLPLVKYATLVACRYLEAHSFA